MANNLKAARLKAGLTQNEAAMKLGMSRSGYVKKEYGNRGLKDDFIKRAAEAFRVPCRGINPR